MQKKIYKFDYKKKILLNVKNTISKIKRQLIPQEKIFTAHTTDKGLMHNTYKEL